MSTFLKDGLKLTDQQSEELSKSGITVGPLRVFWLLYPELSFEAATGGTKILLNGEGQPRTEAFDASGEPSDDFKAAFYA